MTRKKSRILKSFLATALILVLGLSLTIPVNEIYAAAVSQMVWDVDLNNPNTNFNPPFVDGNTIEVINSGNITVSNSGTYNIGAIRADQAVEINTMLVGNTNPAINLTIGSMSGVVKSLNITRFNNATNINITLNGSAGVGDIPSVNDYSALQQVSFIQMCGGGVVQIVLI